MELLTKHLTLQGPAEMFTGTLHADVVASWGDHVTDDEYAALEGQL